MDEDLDSIIEVRMLKDDRTLRVVQKRGAHSFYHIDINVVKGTQAGVRRLDLPHPFEDKSIFKYGLTYVQHHEELTRFILDNQARGNLVIFPEKQFQMCVVLNREDQHSKHFLLYDVFSF
jgi:hypothetical protein